MRWALAAIAVLLAGMPAAHGEGFTAGLPFIDPAAASHLPVLSGSLDVRAPAAGAPTLMHDVSAFHVTGLQVVCWTYPCHKVGSGPLVVRVAAGSTVALRFPETGTLHLVAGQAVATPLTFDAQKAGFADLAAGLHMAPSLVAATKDGRLTLDPETLAPTPDGAVPAQAPPGLPPAVAANFQAPDPDDRNGAVLALLTDASRLQVLDGEQVVDTITGYGGLLLQGTIRVDAVQAQAFVLPCAVRCDVDVADRGVPADLGGAASSILALARLVQGAEVPAFSLGSWTHLLDPVASGVFVDLPLVANVADFRLANLTLVRFASFHASLAPEASPQPGDGRLVIQSGTVRGSPAFVGGRYFGMPLWSYFLWAVALAAVVVAAVTRASKHHEGWDRLRLVGWVAGAVAWAALVLVWHSNFGKVLGVDATSAGLDANSRLVVGAVEAGTLLAMVAMVVLPIRLILSRGFRLARQGRFMGLAGPLASVAGILLGTPLLLGFVNLALRLFE